MDKDDEEKTAFHTSQGVYCYTKMPFGLKNAGATYQRLVDNAFAGQVGRNLEVYVDDLVIKSHTEDELVRDIVETFRALRKINMKLNPKKCTFGATEGMFLGYLIEPDGIKPCPEKTKAVIQLPSPRTMKEVQSLNGKLAGLNRFLSKSADKSLPLFKTLKKCTKKGDFRWTTAAEEAFTQLKQHIAALPTLVAPRPGEELIMYLSATHGAISAVLLTDRDSVQTPVYFVSKALKETEINYSAMEKLILAVISKPDASGRLQKWSVLLGEHNISYRPRTAVKGQILADFLIEKPETNAALSSLTRKEWNSLTHCALNSQPRTTLAEYEAQLAFTTHAILRMGVRNLEANVDSRLVANHVLGEYVAKEDNMIQYLDKTKSLIQGFDRFTIRQVPRGDNKKADALSKIASTSFAHLSKHVCVEILRTIHRGDGDIHGDRRHDPTPRSVEVKTLRSGYYWPPSTTKPRHDTECNISPSTKTNPAQHTTGGRNSPDNGKPFCDNPFKRLAKESKHAWIDIKAGGQRNCHMSCGHIATQSKVSTGDTPFSLVYGTEAVIPAEIGMPTIRTAEVNVAHQCTDSTYRPDNWRTARTTAIREEKAKLQMKGYYDAKVRGVSFRQETSCFVLTTQATRKTQERWDQSGKDPTRLQKHLEKEHTSCVTWTGVSCPARGISAISRNAIFREVLTGSAHGARLTNLESKLLTS
ncbi:reverse transcriptase domain-containing protein [Tanacetum coccineum]